MILDPHHPAERVTNDSHCQTSMCPLTFLTKDVFSKNVYDWPYSEQESSPARALEAYHPRHTTVLALYGRGRGEGTSVPARGQEREGVREEEDTPILVGGGGGIPVLLWGGASLSLSEVPPP